MKKARPAPLGATYKQEIRPSWSGSRSDAAPNGAKRVLFNPSYKGFAPTELCRGIAKRGPTGNHLLEHVEQGQSRKTVTNLADQIFVNFVAFC